MIGEQSSLDRLSRLSQSISAARDLHTVFGALAGFINASAPCDGVFISLYDAESRERRCVYAVVEGREIDASTLPPRSPQSSITVPMTVLGRVIGAFEIQSAEPAVYGDEHAAAMRMAANLAALAIDNVRLTEREDASSRASRASEQRYRALVSTISQMIWSADARGRVNADIPGWRALTGQTLEELRGWGWMNAVHPDDRARAARAWRRAIRTNSLYEAEYRVRTRNGSYRYFAARGAPIVDAGSRIHEWFGVCIDIDEQTRKEELQQFLVESSRLLASPLDYESTLTRVARLAVPLLADSCVVYIVNEDGGAQRLGSAHADSAKAELWRELQRRYPVESHERHPVLAVLRTGQPELIAEVTDSLLEAAAGDSYQLDTYRALAPRSLMLVPLIARGRTLGAVAFAIESSERRYGPRQLLYAEELASRAALAVDNVRLYQAEQEARRRAERGADRISRLQAITGAFSEALTPAQVAEAVVHHGAAALGAGAGFVARLTDDEHALELLRAVGYPETASSLYQFTPLSAPLPATDALRTGEPVWLASPRERDQRYPHLAGLASDTGYQAWAAVPMTVEGRCMGAWGLSFPEPREATDEEIGFMLALGRQCGQALERARLYEESREANRAKSDFLAVMSHELRTPLSAIIGYADLIADEIAGPVSEMQRSQLGRIKASSWHLLQLIEQILAFARMEAGRHEVRLERVDANEIAREAADMLEAGFAGKGVALHLHLPGEPTEIDTDAGKLRQILVNLLGNAMKFTDRGEARLTVSRDADDVVLTVRDTGIGVAPEHLERIFEPFRQVEEAMTRTVGGTGLGLSVTRRLAELLGGDVEVASTPGEGSTFTVRLPARTGADA